MASNTAAVAADTAAVAADTAINNDIYAKMHISAKTNTTSTISTYDIP